MQKLSIKVILLFIGLFPLKNLAQEEDVSFNCVNKEFNELYFMIGEWVVEGTYRLNREHVISKGKSIIQLDLGGCLLKEKFIGFHQNEPYEQINLFSFRNDKFYMVSVETDHGGMGLFIDDNNNGEFSFTIEWNERVMNKHNIFEIGKNAFKTETHLTIDGGSTWNLVQKATYNRIMY